MMEGLQIVVCGSLVPDPLQTLEPVQNSEGPGLKSETMLPSVLDPWAGHALFEAANIAKQVSGSKVYLVSLGPKAKLQQLMMTVAQKVPFELIAIDGSAGGFTDAFDVARILADAIKAIPALDKGKLLLFGGCSSASRDAGVTMQLVGEHLGISEQFMAVDSIKLQDDGSFELFERIEGGQYLASVCVSMPAVVAWATGSLPEPPNNPQVGMMNMRGVMPALQRAQPVQVGIGGIKFEKAEIPGQKRDTRIVKDVSADEIAAELIDWIKS
jgi:electron transfer flavoprotein beta subunit